MRNDTRLAFNAYLQQVATLNGVGNASEKFTVSPTVQQRLESQIQDTSAFLSAINNIGVDEQSGETVIIGVSGPSAGTQDTTGSAERTPRDLSSLDARGYTCTQTNFDTALRYAQIDAWAKFPDFQTRLRDAIVKRQALDVMMIGFHGTSRAATSNLAAHPMLEDVNIGWLEKIRQNWPERRMHEVVAASNAIRVGHSAAGAVTDYDNLDALVFDLTNELIDPWFREDPNLVCVMGRKLLADKYFPLLNVNQRPEDQLAIDMIISQKRVGGLQAIAVPFFPDNALLITRLDNLSRYYQIGSRRRTIRDWAPKDRIENFESSNDAYVIEQPGCVAFAENIVISNGGH